MEPVHHQKEANKFMEGGVFYPTGHIVAAFESAKAARKAQTALQADMPEDHVVFVDAREMEREAEENLEDASFLSAGASVPTRQKQLELAREGCHFLLIFAPDDEDQQRVMSTLHGHAVKYAVKYHRLIIENLVKDIASTTTHKEPARSP